MGSRRTLILIVAVLVGLFSAFALFTYVGGIEDNANGKVERVSIFKIVQDIPKGTFGDEAFAQGLIEPDVISKEYLPATAITDPRQIEGLVAISDLPANTIVVGQQFVSQAESLSSFSSLLKNNEVAITISVDQIHGVASLLVPGDFVNMLVNSQPEGPASVYARPARFLYQKIQILAVGQDRKLEPGETAVTNPDGTPVATGSASGLITFAVPADASQRIASVSGSDFYLTLVPKDYQPSPLPPIDTAGPLPGETPGQVTPYGPAGRPPS